MTPTGEPGADESSPVAVALTGERSWTGTRAGDLEAVDPGLQVARYPSVAAVLSASADVDCVVVGPESDDESAVDRCRRLEAEEPGLAVVAVVGPDGSPATWPDGDVRPAAVHVAEPDVPRPTALAWCVRTAVRSSGGGPPAQDARDGLDALFAAVPTPLVVTGPDGAVERTNPPYKATFGLAATLPAELPAEPPTDGVAVRCETLDDTRPFEYATVALDGGRTCHVLADRTVQAAEEPSRARDGEDSDTDQPAPSPVAKAMESLTERQREVLACAHDGGFFERPKAHNSDELAESLGITRSTFLQHLRAAQRKLLDALLAESNNGGMD